MADGFSVSMNANVQQYGLQTTLNVAEDVDELPNFPDEMWGDVISTARQKMGGFYMETTTYSQAKEILENGTVKTQFPVPDPLIFLSLTTERDSLWQSLSSGIDIENVFIQSGADEYGVGGWTSHKILDELISEFDLDFTYGTEFIEYPIAYYRVSPYGSIVNEFKKMYSGLPIIFVYETMGQGNAGIRAMLPAHVVDPLDMEADDFKGKVSVSFQPQRKVQVVVYGDWGEPDFDGEEASFEHIMKIEPLDDVLGTIVWFQDSVLGKRGDPVSLDLTGKLTGANFEKGFLTSGEFTWDHTVNEAYVVNADTSGTRYEVLTKGGQTVSTIASRTEHVNRLTHVTGDIKENRTVQYNVQDVVAISYGEPL